MHVDLCGPPQTMLATLYAKALDADSPHSILHDQHAKSAVDRLDYDWSQTTITRRSAPAVAARSAHFDLWVGQFVAAHPRSVVLHVGCGLDARVWRIDPGPEVEWYDIDHAGVISLREQVYSAREHAHLVAASVTDPAWLTDIPADRPTLLIGEGLTMYLTRDDGLGLLNRVVARFSSGELQFDAFSRAGIRAQFTNAVVRRSGSRLYWGIDSPADIAGVVPGLRLLAALPVVEAATFKQLPWPYPLMGRVMSSVPVLRRMATYHRYAFGAV
ncbi:class I SAM-dependent methyltransferase [Mycolicibacterium mengxianglii]|uniref:class I SAM-dependent methyltransferase n=1 Tax=Mycolicibacterium mengxianglii TaxID=2736649 RepID=UPI0018EED0EE|nr:class I SAM-dependent methyltransferase [Mycolicibacterium mengxianglii]